MLEIKNVKKTYHPKKGVPVKALDDVSLAFEDTGMVFILGKSGSGKSTLLNVLGGLDQADSGEFIIKGKSSRDFSQSDFDSYRNTFIGFIFQEYNILSEFTVAQNIALAMELQGKRATSEELSAILEEVDLTGYANRKPNELSGGQKQRVAIARALIKHPEMIMADEPTGALDSNTGKQVFDTLKKLSKTKLVLIVSHDRDFAEQYADRIIELKDGQILSDVSKKNIPPVSHNHGVSVIDDKIIRVKQGYKLTEKDLSLINDYIANAKSDALISLDRENNAAIKKVININDEGGKDTFLDTLDGDVKLKTYKPEDSRLIRSKLPYKNSFKIGASSLKAKPIRLAFTVLLCFIAFTLFGLADTVASYNKSSSLTASIIDSSISYAAFSKQTVSTRDGGYLYYNDVLLTDGDLDMIKNETGIELIPVYVQSQGSYTRSYSLSGSMTSANELSSPNGVSVYTASVSGFAEITDDVLADNGFELLNGRLPTSDREIAIPKFIYDQFMLAGIIHCTDIENDLMKTIAPKDMQGYESVVGKVISSGYNLGLPSYVVEFDGYGKTCDYYTIVGVYDTHFDATGYENYLPDAERVPGSMGASLDAMKLQSETQLSFHSVIAVNEGFLNTIMAADKNENAEFEATEGVRPEVEGGDAYITVDYMGTWVDVVLKLDQLSRVGDVVWIDGAKTSLAKNEVLIPLTFEYSMAEVRPLDDSFLDAVEEKFGITFAEETRLSLSQNNYWTVYENPSDLAKYIVGEAPAGYVLDNANQLGFTVNPDGSYSTPNGTEGDDLSEYVLTDEFKELYGEEFLRHYCSDLFINYNDEGLFYENRYDENLSGEMIKNAVRKIAIKILNVPQYANEAVLKLEYAAGSEDVDYVAVGYYIPDSDAYSYSVCVADELYNLYGQVEHGDYAFALGKMPIDNADAVGDVVDFSLTTQDICVYNINNKSATVINYIGDILEGLSQGFLYVGIGFAVFSALMMFNFISVSVSFKKREIGILRAVGARSSDVFGIFFNESLVITIINFALSATATGIVASILNNMFQGYGMPITILNFGIRQIALLLALGVGVAFIGSFIPVMNIAKKRPIDAIQNR